MSDVFGKTKLSEVAESMQGEVLQTSLQVQIGLIPL